MFNQVNENSDEQIVCTYAVIPFDGNIYEEDFTKISDIVDIIYIFVEIEKGDKNYKLMYQDVGNDGVEDFRLYDSNGTNDDARRYINDIYNIGREHKDYSNRSRELSDRYLKAAREELIIKITEVTMISLLLKECELTGSETLVDADDNAKTAVRWIEDILHSLPDDTLDNIEAATSGAELREALSGVIEQIDAMDINFG